MVSVITVVDYDLQYIYIKYLYHIFISKYVNTNSNYDIYLHTYVICVFHLLLYTLSEASDFKKLKKLKEIK